MYLARLFKKSKKLIFCFLLLMFALTSIIVTPTLDNPSYDFEMVTLSALFFLILTYAIGYERNKYSPLVFFSVLFYGYVASGFYFSCYENIHAAKFFNFYGDFTTLDMKISLYQVMLGYLFYVAGHYVGKNIKVKKLNLAVEGFNFRSGLIKFILVSLFLISLCYWIFVSFRLASGPINLLSNMGIYVHLLEDNYISTAPYLLAYMSTSLLFLLYLNNNKSMPLYLYFMILVSFIIYLSTARLSGSVFYLLSFPLMYFIYGDHKINFKVSIYLLIFIFLFGSLYFYRFYSNLVYLNMEMEGDWFELIGEHFFGMTNVGDLQSVTFANQYVKDLDYLYGSSFTDFLMSWTGKLTGLEIENTSIGIRLREYYFSHVETGAPAPGIISEMIMNFGYLGLTVVMFIFGILTRLISKSIDYRLSIFNLYVYTNFLLFILLLTKVDSTHLNSFLWSVMPFFVLVFLLKPISHIQIGYLRNMRR